MSQTDKKTDAPSLPEDLDVKHPGGIGETFAKVAAVLLSRVGLSTVIGALTFFILAFLLAWDYLGIVSVVENGVSTEDVYAPFELLVEDVDKTAGQRELARQSIAPIYQPEQPINREIREQLNSLLKGLATLNTSPAMSAREKRLAYLELFGRDQQAQAHYSHLVNDAMDSRKIAQLQEASQGVTEKLIRRGLNASDYVGKRDPIIASNLLPWRLGAEDKVRVGFIVSRAIKPNRVLDVTAMNQAQQAAESLIQPETRAFKKSERIVERGTVVSPVQMKALEKIGKSVQGINWYAFWGVILLTGFFCAGLWGFIYRVDEGRFFSPAYTALLGSLMVIFSFVFKAFLQNDWLLYAYPLAAFTLIVALFTKPRVAVMATMILSFLLALTLKVDLDNLFVLLFGSLVGLYAISRRLDFSDRTQLTFTGLYIGVTNALLILTVFLIDASSIMGNDWHALVRQLSVGFFVGGIVSGVVTFGALPYLERIFGLVTQFTLKDLDNHDHPLLKRMQFEAPGTFHHSLMIASLAEAAAEAIGANPLLARVGSLYHDIGKMKRPLFFVENQAYYGAENPHDKLTPRLSKMVITAHPRDSLEMAKQNKLPEVIQKFMTEHHGTLVAGYFYNKACEEEGVENVNKSQFRYPGPKPNIKETAIVMLADACESAVRAMKNPTVAHIEERIDKLFQQRIDDGQFDNCPITFKEIATVRDTFVRVLRGIQHTRIEYQQTMMQELHRKLPHQAATQLQADIESIRNTALETTAPANALPKIVPADSTSPGPVPEQHRPAS